MPKKLTGPHRAELARLRDRCLLVLDFFAQRGGLADDVPRLRAIVEKAVAQGNLGGLRALGGDLREWMRALPERELNELEQTLATRFGPEVEWDGLKREEKIRAIITRGKVTTETEYRLVSDYLDEIADDPSRAQEVIQLTSALTSYA